MDDMTWVAARAAQAVSRHLNAAESEATTYAARLQRASVAALEPAPPANESARAPVAAFDDERTSRAGRCRRAA